MGGMGVMPGGMRGSVTGGNMGGSVMMTSAGGAGGLGSRGGGSGAVYSATYSVMPADQLELDAHSMDRQLMDGSSGHLQLLLALMKAGDWEHALLMLDWLQVWFEMCSFCVLYCLLNA
jgi:hypothetical protein